MDVIERGNDCTRLNAPELSVHCGSENLLGVLPLVNRLARVLVGQSLSQSMISSYTRSSFLPVQTETAQIRSANLAS